MNRLLEFHKSDPACPARLFFERTTPQPSGPSAVVGVLAHEVLQRHLIEEAEHGRVDPAAVVREVAALHRDDPEATPDVLGNLVEIMAGAFAKTSELRLGMPPDGWNCAPEWRFGLSEAFDPVAACASCGGAAYTPPWKVGAVGAPCDACAAHPGWSADVAFVGTIDRLEWNEKKGLVRALDFKTIMEHVSGDDIPGDREARIYSFALLRWFAGVKSVTFGKCMLRWGYIASREFKRGEPWENETRVRLTATRERRKRFLADGVWPEELGPGCQYCPRLNVCAAMKRAVAEGLVESAPIVEQANIWLGVKAWMGPVEARLRAHVAATESPIDLANDDGEALGLRPGADKRLVISYEVAMERLRLLGMTPEMEVEHFRYVTRSGLAARIEKVAAEIVGRKTARGLLYSEFEPWIEPMTDFSFGVWTPEPRAPRREMTEDEINALIDERLGGG